VEVGERGEPMGTVDVPLNVFQRDCQYFNGLWVILTKCPCQLLADVHLKCRFKYFIPAFITNVVGYASLIDVFLVQSICGRIIHERRVVANEFKHGVVE
jgi:hypothetical protein